ncbi:Transcription factor DYT1 [Linum perenne]
MEFVATKMNKMSSTKPQVSKKRTAAKSSRHGGDHQHQHHADDEAKGYKSKNLLAERKRRQKLTDRLHMLRASVPIITNMTKAMIIDDAITYIQELTRNVEVLSDQLEELSDSEQGCGGSGMISQPDENHGIGSGVEGMTHCEIQEEVEVLKIDEKKLWVKIVMEKRRGRFTRLLEAMTRLGLQPIHTNLTTSKGVFLVSFCVEVAYEDVKSIVQRIKELLIQIVRGI